MSWIIRWDTRDDRPSVLGARDVAAVPLPAGGFAVMDGYLFDTAELALRGEHGASLLASAWERWGDALWDKLRGGFAAAIWDPGEQRVVIGRDAMGLTPCFHAWNGRVLVASPSLDAVLADPSVDPAFHRVVIAEYLLGSDLSPRGDETFYRYVRRLPPAHALAVTPRGHRVVRYWDPVPPGFAWATPEEVARFEPMLERAVDRCLSAGADSIALSGGFDSVSLATLAAGRRGDRAPLHALSLRFADAGCDEAPTQVAVARALGLPQLIRTSEEALAGNTAVAAALELSPRMPSPVMSPWQSCYTGLFRTGRALGLRRIVMGTGGDDMLNVDRSYGADRLAALDLGGLWRYFRATRRTSPFSASRVARGVLWDGALVPGIRRLGRRALERVSPPLLDRIRRRRLRARPAWLSRSDPALIDALDRRQLDPMLPERAPGEGGYALAIRQLAQAPLFLLEQDHVHAWTRGLGVLLLLPYFDRDVVELSLRMPPEYLIAGGRHKSPLRRLVADRLPSVPMRAKKVDFTHAVHRVLRAGGRDAWQALGRGQRLADLGLVDGRALDRYIEGYLDGRHAEWRRVWIAIATEAWLGARSRTTFTSAGETAP